MGIRSSHHDYTSIPPDRILSDFNSIITNKDAIEWIKASFVVEGAVLKAVNDLEGPGRVLRKKSYSSVNGSNRIVIFFEFIHPVSGKISWTSFQYSPSIKS